MEPSTDLLQIAKQTIEKDRRRKIAAKLQGRKRPESVRLKISASRKGYVMPATQKLKISQAGIVAAAKRGTRLIPFADRMPLVVKMYREGASTGAIAQALGWSKGNGYGMVKRLEIQAGLR
jgi:hypothetical protein